MGQTIDPRALAVRFREVADILDRGDWLDIFYARLRLGVPAAELCGFCDAAEAGGSAPSFLEVTNWGVLGIKPEGNN